MISKKSPPRWETKFGGQRLELSETEFYILRDLILERIGLFYHENKRDLLEDKLSPLVLEKGLQSFLDYYYLLKYDSEAAIEWKRVVEILRVPETFFFREYDQIQALVELIPKFINQKPLRIWSAACSTGEEPLSIAMALHETGWFSRANIEIVALDISESAIGKAQQGLYRAYSFRNFPEDLRSKYFSQAQGLWRIDSRVHSRVQWNVANITAKDELAAFAPAHFIFCRNVFIYFTEEMVRRTVQQFYKFLSTPGYLFVGSSESLLKLMTEFELQEINGAFVYIKR